MSTRFLLVRHAACSQTESILLGRTLDPPLDGRGHRQARALAHFLARERPHRVLSSPRLRAQETAQIVAGEARCEWRAAHELDEMDFGAWSGHSFAELEHDPTWRHWNTHRSRSRTPAGDDIRCVQTRIALYLERLRRSCREATLVLVTHAEIIRSALLYFRGLPIEDYRYIDIPFASINVLRTDGLRIRVESERERRATAAGECA